MTNIAKIFTVAVTLVVGTGAISGIALANINPFYPDRLEESEASPFRHLEWGAVSRPPIGSAIRTNEPSVSLPSPGVGSGIPAPYRIGN